MRCKKAELQVPNTPPPTLWKSSIHAGSAHITSRKTVRMCSIRRRIHFRFLAHSLANARSLGLRRADDTITVLAALNRTWDEWRREEDARTHATERRHDRGWSQ